MIVAILDLGTNTCNLLIAEVSKDKSFQILYEEKTPVLLGKKGTDKRYITSEANERTLTVFEKYHQIISEYKAEYSIAFGTSAMRSSLNAAELAEKIQTKVGIHIEIIDGEREAQLIYKGIRLTGCLDNEYSVIMDIGGGSTEFIIGNSREILWKNSFELGSSILLRFINPSDPMTQDEINKCELFLDKELKILYNAFFHYPCKKLIGASGAFDSFYSMITVESNSTENNKKYHLFEPGILEQLHYKLLKSTLAEREKMPGLPVFRANYIVLASVFVNFVKNKLKVNEIIHSAYALKEGALAEVIEHLK